jgi:ABC-type oligopeptide transport system ATPase subunit
MSERETVSGGSGLVLDRLSKVFQRRGNPPVHAVAGIELAVAEGELLGLL